MEGLVTLGVEVEEGIPYVAIRELSLGDFVCIQENFERQINEIRAIKTGLNIRINWKRTDDLLEV